MDIPTSSAEIRAAKSRIDGDLRTAKLKIGYLEGQLKALQAICEHDMERWHTNPMGRWPTNHEQCRICGLHRET